MANPFEQIMNNIRNGNVYDNRLNRIVDEMVLDWDKNKPDRFGLHISDLKEPFKGVNQFCYRKHTLAKKYKPNETMRHHIDISTLRVYLEGWYVHLKWQHLFKNSGMALEIEKTRYDKVFGVYYTPDIIAVFRELTGDAPWIIEIKSMSPSAYEKASQFYDPKKVHLEGYKQAQIYMFLTGSENGALLLDNKGNQNHRELAFKYDPEFVQPYVHRLNVLSQVQVIHEVENRIPKRVCESPTSNRAVNCPMKDVCWAPKEKREKFLLKEKRSEEQKNSSIIHNES